MFKHIRAAAVLFVFALAAAAQSPAQNWNNVKALAAGTNVRISTGSRTVNGQVQGVTDDSLAVNSGKGQEMFTRQEIAQVSVRTKARRKRSTLIGLAVGAGSGAAFGGAAAASCSGSICGGHGAALIAGVAAAGGIVGALIGAGVSHGGWREVYKR